MVPGLGGLKGCICGDTFSTLTLRILHTFALAGHQSYPGILIHTQQSPEPAESRVLAMTENFLLPLWTCCRISSATVSLPVFDILG